MDELSCMDILYTALFDLLNDSGLTEIADIGTNFKQRSYCIALRDGTEAELCLRPLRRKESCDTIPVGPHSRAKEEEGDAE